MPTAGRANANLIKLIANWAIVLQSHRAILFQSHFVNAFTKISQSLNNQIFQAHHQVKGKHEQFTNFLPIWACAFTKCLKH